MHVRTINPLIMSTSLGFATRKRGRVSAEEVKDCFNGPNFLGNRVEISGDYSLFIDGGFME